MRQLNCADLFAGAGGTSSGAESTGAAQGFAPHYVFCGTKSDVTRQIGNSVSPPVAAAITRAIAGVV